jgi:hypothetical protein
MAAGYLERSGGMSKSLKPLDLSYVMKHAFLSGIVAARNIPGDQPIDGAALWLDYDPTGNQAYDRVVAALGLEGGPE